MLHINHRPTKLSEIIGNQETVRDIESILQRDPDRIPRAYLFEGPSGCGKTTIARILAAEIGAAGMDFNEVDSADFRGIDFVRDLRAKMHLAPREGDRRAWLLDECHQLSKDAQAALLKALEDTPSHVILMLATTDPEKLLPTIRNRCTRFALRPLKEEQLYKLMRNVLRKEGKKVKPDILEKIASHVQGSPRAALTTLDKVIDSDPDEFEMIYDEVETEVIDLCRALIKGSTWKKVAPILEALRSKTEPESIRRAVLGYCSSIMLKDASPQAYVLMDAFRENFYDLGFPGLIMACYEANETNKG